MESKLYERLRGNCPAIYGPVRSRRHGLSLGINLGDETAKICTWGCVYCQCGMGKRAGEAGKLGTLPDARLVLEGLEQAVARHPDLDSVTIAGNSEPTSHPQFAEVVRGVLAFRERTGARWIFNCLSNGSELDDERVREACDSLDEIWVKLDCADEELFRRLSRPVARVGSVSDHVRRIRLLKKPRIQTLLWKHPGRPELSNYTGQNLSALLRAFAEIRPLMVNVTTVQRTTPVEGLASVSESELESFASAVRDHRLACQSFS